MNEYEIEVTETVVTVYMVRAFGDKPAATRLRVQEEIENGVEFGKEIKEMTREVRTIPIREIGMTRI